MCFRGCVGLCGEGRLGGKFKVDDDENRSEIIWEHLVPLDFLAVEARRGYSRMQARDKDVLGTYYVPELALVGGEIRTQNLVLL